MTNKPARYLIATADERTWKFDRPVIFLGEWCRVYDRKHIWQDMDAIVAMPYGLGLAKKDADSNEARALEDSLLSVLCEALNEHHGVQQSERFWRIVLGHWLRRMINVVLNRVKSLEQCLLTYEISGFTAYSNDDYGLITTDSSSLILAVNDDHWNSKLTMRILNLLGAANFPIEVINQYALPDFRFNELPNKPTLKRTFLKWGYKQVSVIARYLQRDDDAFIISTYLPRKEAIKLELTLGQFPQMWSSPKFDVVAKIDFSLRENLGKQFVRKSGSNLEKILSAMLFELLPVCFLEGFANLHASVEQQSWPKKPKFIFTSNAFDTDEVFKFWAASKVESGSKYFVGQHGNNYGTYRFMVPMIEELTADKFLTWGWTDGLPQHTPAFVFKLAGRKTENYNPLGGLLLIESCLMHRTQTWDVTSEFTYYFNEQMEFVSKLASAPRRQLTIRLRDITWNQEARWCAFDSTIKIDAGDTNLSSLIAGSRLVVHSYDSTGILETLLQNIPTLAFWQNDFDHLRESAKPYYQLLVDVGIVHLTAESVTQKVNEVWDDVDGWWGGSEIQSARRQFCERYARTSENPAQKLKQILLM